MFKYFMNRLAQMLVTLFIVSILVFVLANFIGDPVNMLVSPKAPPEVREQVREELGLNRPILEQYVSFVTNAVKGDFGKSYIYKVDVLSLIAQRVPATLELVFVSVVLALVISIPLGVYAGAFPKRKSSTLVMGGSILGISLPSFFIGIMLIYIFSLKLHWFPSSGRGATAPFLGMNFSLFAPGGLKYIILPAFTLSVTNIASLVRLTRAGVMENMRQDYIKFARAKGVSTRKVLFGHALKNALIPVITVFGMEIGSLIAFTTVTETIFSWPGLGKLLIDSINSVDRPVIVAYLILTTVLFVFINFVVDLLYTVIDPRIQFRRCAMDEMKKRGATPNKSLFRRIAESEFFHNYKRSPSAIVGTVIVVLVLFIALFGPLFAPQNPYDVASLSLTDSYKPPAWEAGGDARFIFGTDSQGRDIFSSLIYGSRISLFIGVVGTLLACAVGITLGLISGYFGGRVDAIIMRLADILLSFPDILVALFIMTMFGRGVSKLLVVFTIIGCVTYVRTVRAEVLTVKQMEYVDAARVIGIPNILIIAKHVLPNVMTTVIVISTMKVGGLILAEATLSFLGAGVPVTEPSLGMLVKNGFDVLFSGYWWIAVMPGLYIMLIVFGINLLGDFLRDEFNPKLK